jgi:hypothetical protein
LFWQRAIRVLEYDSLIYMATVSIRARHLQQQAHLLEDHGQLDEVLTPIVRVEVELDPHGPEADVALQNMREQH